MKNYIYDKLKNHVYIFLLFVTTVIKLRSFKEQEVTELMQYRNFK